GKRCLTPIYEDYRRGPPGPKPSPRGRADCGRLSVEARQTFEEDPGHDRAVYCIDAERPQGLHRPRGARARVPRPPDLVREEGAEGAVVSRAPPARPHPADYRS